MAVGENSSSIATLAALPLFFRLQGRPVLLCGGGEGAAWKAELLASTGAEVRIVATNASQRLTETARRLSISIEVRMWRAGDFDGIALALLETESDEEAGAFRDMAKAAGAPVNVIDRPRFCDFSFGAIVNRSPLVIGISTDGSAPVFGQTLRTRIEAILPASLARWAGAARDWRDRLAGASFARRRRFWENFAARALASVDRAPEEADFEAISSEIETSRGRVLIVGAGPGDPELLTLKAVRALQSADVVLHDRMASPGVLELARREARRIDVGKRAGQPSMSQPEITALLVSLALEGKTVVRLKGGDPSVFGRANEEIDAARAAGLAVTIVPGVTTALAAAAELGLSLTDRDRARRVQFVTARDPDGELPDDLDWRALADPHATTAVYMGARGVAGFVAHAITAGLDPATPAHLIENVSLANTSRVSAPIAELPARLVARAGPAILLYGYALEARA